MTDLFAVILAGGRGTRFWPLSRRALPKQCLSIDGGPTLIQRTVARTGLPADRVLVVTGPDMAEAIRAQIPGIDVLVEPSARNTGPAVAWAAVEVARRGGSAFAVLPSDHVIRDEAAFRRALATALRVARTGALVTLGVRPTRPETAFGWIELGEAAEDREGGEGDRAVARFVEKPPIAVAEQLLAGGRHLWNAGMFVWRVDAILAAIDAHLPRTAAAVRALRAGAALGDCWGEMEATSIDYGVMERARNIRVVPVDFGWSDVGSWSALEEVLDPADGGVAVAAAAVALRSSGNIAYAPGKLVALLGVEGLVVVDTGDVLMVARKDDVQSVRDLLAEVERRGLGRYA